MLEGGVMSGDNLFSALKLSQSFSTTPISDTFGILWTLTTSEFQRCFAILPTPSPFQ